MVTLKVFVMLTKFHGKLFLVIGAWHQYYHNLVTISVGQVNVIGITVLHLQSCNHVTFIYLFRSSGSNSFHYYIVSQQNLSSSVVDLLTYLGHFPPELHQQPAPCSRCSVAVI